MTIAGGTDGDAEASTNVAAFIEEARRYVLAEDERSRSFLTGATTLVAAIGVVLSISLALGDRLHDRDLFVTDTLADVIYVVGAVLLTVAGGVAIAAIFPPAVDRSDFELLRQYQLQPKSTQPFDTTQKQLLQQLRAELGSTKTRNGRARDRLKLAAPLFGAGALVIAFLGTTIAVTPKSEKSARSTSHTVSDRAKKGKRVVTNRKTTTKSSP